MILLLIFYNDRRGREYLWFAAFLLLDGSMSLEAVVKNVYPLLPRSVGYLTDALGMIGRYAPLVGFIAAFTESVSTGGCAVIRFCCWRFRC